MTMQRRQRTHGLLGTAAAAVLLAMTLGLAGCGSDGDDGAQGPPGQPGEPGPPGAPAPGTITSLSVEITDVAVSSPPVVEFRVADQSDLGFTDLQQGDVTFTFAKLVPRPVGAGHDWQSYINRTETPAPGPWPGTAPTTQATGENNGTLESLGGGDYRYTFNNDVTNITTPIPVAWEPTLTHRVAMQLETRITNQFGAVNAWKDFIPAGGDPIATREIATTATCNTCHDRLAIHGGRRVEVEYCVTCHNPGSVDANSGESVDMKVMIHKIHRGENLPRIAAGASYTIWGFRNEPHDYSDVRYPYEALVQGNNEPAMACARCHTADEPRPNSGVTPTSDGNLWKTGGHSSIPTCGSCHEDVPGIGPAGAAWINDTKFDHTTIATNLDAGGLPQMCSTCHNVAQVHRLDTFEKADRIAVQFDGNPVLDQAANTLTARFRLVDTANADAVLVHGQTYSHDGLDGLVDYNLRSYIGWNTVELRTYSDSTDLNSAGQAIRFNNLPVGSLDALVDDYYQVVYELPPDRIAEMVAAGGSGLLGIMYQVSVGADAGLRFPNGVVPFAITDAEPVMRRTVATIETCNTCHLSISFHGGNRTDNLQGCAMCHNSNLYVNGIPASRGYPEGVERNSSLMNMVHAIHANSAHRAGVDGKEIRYPGLIQNCSQCHVPGSNELPLMAKATGISVGLQDGGDINVASTHLKATPTYSACASCHDNNAAKGHMLAMGGADGLGFDGSGTNLGWTFDMPDATGESCAVCHGPGRDSDVAEVHKW
jgi:OmcA/MtrC family decaheme c-type cytochrome